MRFYDGQPVVCINDHFTRRRWWRIAVATIGLTLPVRGHRYVVRGYVDAPGPPCLLLREIANPPVMYSDGKMRECSFWEGRFAPTTDIGDLEKCLTRKGLPRQLDRDNDEWDNRRRKRQKEDA